MHIIYYIEEHFANFVRTFANFGKVFGILVDCYKYIFVLFLCLCDDLLKKGISAPFKLYTSKLGNRKSIWKFNVFKLEQLDNGHLSLL